VAGRRRWPVRRVSRGAPEVRLWAASGVVAGLA
jgi:hypothetical protein